MDPEDFETLRRPRREAELIYSSLKDAAMKAFLDENFLLSNDVSQKLYHHYATPQPILDYHCHLPVKDIAENRRFANLFEIWLDGDHYKWRAMRANGVAERYITGDAAAYDKFLAWARTVPYTLRNPLYHWTHLELQRYFGITDLLDEASAPSIWERANADLSQKLTAHEILRKFRVEVVCTTDDPTDDLCHHRAIANSDLNTRVFPAFRPDKALTIGNPEFLTWTEKLSKAANVDIRNLNGLLDALRKRHEDFHSAGCRLSDHGLDLCYATPCPEKAAAATFESARNRKAISGGEAAQFASFMMLFFARLDAEKGWTKQLHLGALRNVNSAARNAIGPDTGYDTVGDFPQIRPLACYLDLLARKNALPRMILYNNNPADTFALATLIGCFQNGSQPGKIQYGSAWWFLDQKEGITAQLNALSNVGLLSRFVGMVTDSRSFMSYPRHEYFRRVLCNVIGQEVAAGELPDNEALLGRLIQDVCYQNARNYLHLPDSNSATDQLK
ncbi:MAG TPA: glucuronate isomerase [Candidatus Sulfotelmatobacter sp.]|nr:glucuronate isomerase [Candidatus Sulfotelmatobacter sp.]